MRREVSEERLRTEINARSVVFKVVRKALIAKTLVARFAPLRTLGARVGKIII